HFTGRANGRFEWLIAPLDTGSAVGWISLRLGDHGAATAELGYSLLVGARGHGYAAESVGLLCDEAFASTPLRRIEAACVVANLPSRRLLERLGFNCVRTQRHGAVVRGQAVDIMIFEVVRDRWLRRRAAAALPSGGGRSRRAPVE
ncbi:MAG TPA: GNAT family N-acetyltransferase, partial [Candidatus Baltobacteraceae bacterium]